MFKIPKPKIPHIGKPKMPHIDIHKIPDPRQLLKLPRKKLIIIIVAIVITISIIITFFTLFQPKPIEIEEKPKCTDSDNERLPTLKGTCNDTTGTVEDYCGSERLLIEYWCYENYCTSTPIRCETFGMICENGICKKA